MKGIRFYEEYTDQYGKCRGQVAHNCIAVLVGNVHKNGGGWCEEALASVFSEPNSAVCVTGVSVDYLRETCKRISEARARQVHPALFERLDVAKEVSNGYTD